MTGVVGYLKTVIFVEDEVKTTVFLNFQHLYLVHMLTTIGHQTSK